jgi:MinD superfamily P-loop ATPase
MILAVASGKGGTGKTTFAVNLAWALAERGSNVRLLDCDVEEPNDHLFVRPVFTERTEVTALKPEWDAAACTACGACAEACRYNAMALVKGQVLIFNELCHACGVCTHVCPAGALRERPVTIGTVEAAPGNAPFPFAHGTLKVAETLAPTVVRAVKAHLDPDAVNLIDAAPGTACPVVEAVLGADAALLVTEPTPFGLHDLKLAAGLSLSLGVPTGIIVNRSDGEDRLIADYAASVGLPIAGRIPFKRAYAEAYADGRILAQEFPELRETLLRIYDTMAAVLAPVPEPEHVSAPSGPAAPLPMGTATAYRELTIISGKGGTGKTTVAASLAHLADDAVLADNDVDAADMHLLLAPRVREAHDFDGGSTALIDADACIGCGKCAAACHFNAIRLDGPANTLIGKTYRVADALCEGCGLCERVCPVDAARIAPRVTGQWFVSDTQQGTLVHACLGIAEENSGRLVAKVRERAAQLAAQCRHSRILGDGPPGTGCPVIASVSGTDLVLAVTEPTVSGVHDLERVLALAAHFRVPVAVVINKADLHAGQAERIEALARAHGTEVIGRIPFDPAVNAALMAGRAIVEDGAGPAADAVRAVWSRVQRLLQTPQTQKETHQ